MTEDKCDLLLKLLGRHDEVSIHVDGRHPDIELPSKFWESPSVRVDIGWKKVKDLSVHPIRGVYATVRFGDGWYVCTLPWAAVFGYSAKGQVFVWPGEVPAAVRHVFQLSERTTPTDPQTPIARARAKSHLRLVPRPAPEDPDPGAA